MQLALSPPLPSPGQHITVHLNSHLSLKVEGVIEHSGKASEYMYMYTHKNHGTVSFHASYTLCYAMDRRAHSYSKPFQNCIAPHKLLTFKWNLSWKSYWLMMKRYVPVML